MGDLTPDCGLSWEEEPFEIKLQEIEDDSIRLHVHMLNEVVEQLHRIRAAARFFEVIGAHPDCGEANRAFFWWERHSVYAQLAREAAEDGDEKQERYLSLAAKARALAYEGVVRLPADSLSTEAVAEAQLTE